MRRDEVIAGWIKSGRLRVQPDTGFVFSPLSNTPTRPLGYKTKKGYLRACINFSGRRQFHFMVHRIVWIAVNGVPPRESDQINHVDTIKTHNWIGNLELVTNAENQAHAKAHDLLRPVRQEAHYNARLTAVQVAVIRERKASGESAVALSLEFSVSASHIRRLARGKRWSDSVQERPNG
jgi:hypothetical protein